MPSNRLGWAVLCVVLGTPDGGGAPAPDRAPWGEPVIGLKARLLSRKAHYRVGEPLLLTLEIVNASKGPLVIEGPELMPLISYPNSHPYAGKRPFPWVITCESPGQMAKICWAARQAAEKKREMTLLGPGEVYRVEITATSRQQGEEKDTERRVGEPQRETVAFIWADTPGTYLLTASFAASEDERKEVAGRAWAGRKLQTPAVRVDVGK
jgi:hypothetical protein